MLEPHSPHSTVHTWKDAFIHIAIIAFGLLIAISLEQTVEYIHHRHQARVARESIQREIDDNIVIVQKNPQSLVADRRQLMEILDLLDSGASDVQVIPHLNYAWSTVRQHEAAWEAAKIDGSLALIPSSEIGSASFAYVIRENINSTIWAHHAEMETIAGIGEHAKSTGKLTPLERQQLSSITASALGDGQVIYVTYEREVQALQSTNLR
jgi:beta-galactosidase/beta-glucuronidase